MTPNKIGAEYLNKLQAIYYQIGRRGIVVDQARLQQASRFIKDDITKQLAIVSKQWGCTAYIGAGNKPPVDIDSINLNSSSGSNTPLQKLKAIGYKIPKVSSRDEDGNYVSKESLAELTLQKIFSENQFAITGGDPAIRALLRIRELATLDSRYINANLYKQDSHTVFLSSYNVAGTTSGRRASRKHIFGFGNNAQNFPKHGELASVYRRALVARPGHILLNVDQMQAEDWPVSALAENHESISDLLNGVDRHIKLACIIFGISAESKTPSEWKDSIERYLGKKTRHANNYGMRGNTMSDSLAKEGHSLTPAQCTNILNIVNKADPSVAGVFHAYVKKQLSDKRMLVTPFGRERIFFGLRPGETSSNNKIYNEAFSYIPQSTVGDNTGFAVYELETGSNITRGRIIQESHDNICQEIPDNVESIWRHLKATERSFDREIQFHNEIKLTIPVEGELGYDFAHTVSFKNSKTGSKRLKDLTYVDIQAAWYKLQEHKEKERLIDAAAEVEQKLDI